MTAPLELRILSAEGTVLETRAVSVNVPAAKGNMGILQHHAAMIVSLTAGTVDYKDADGVKQSCPITGGIAEIKDDKIIILLE